VDDVLLFGLPSMGVPALVSMCAWLRPDVTPSGDKALEHWARGGGGDLDQVLVVESCDFPAMLDATRLQVLLRGDRLSKLLKLCI